MGDLVSVIGWRAILLLPALLAIALWDIRTRRIPNSVIAVLLAADWLLFAAENPDLMFLACTGFYAVLAGGAALVVGAGLDAAATHLGGVRAIGGGDVKLVAAFAAMPTCGSLCLVLFFSCVLALLFAFVTGSGRKDTIPFGPFLAAGFMLGSIAESLVV